MPTASSVPGGKLTINGGEIPLSSVSLKFKQGVHEIKAKAQGYESAEKEINVSAPVVMEQETQGGYMFGLGSITGMIAAALSSWWWLIAACLGGVFIFRRFGPGRGGGEKPKVGRTFGPAKGPVKKVKKKEIPEEGE